MTDIKISAFPWVPGFAQGLVRDIRARWALEEAGLAYEERLLGADYKSSQSYRALQPFAQVPVYEENGLVLFESGAIVLHIAERSEALMPADPDSRARITGWMFCALNTIEPPIMNLALVDFFHAGEEWAQLYRPAAIESIKSRLTELAARLDGRDYLEDRFSAADLLMTTVLRALRHTDLVAQIPALENYRLRCEARPAFQKALADQMATFARHTVADMTPAN
ncbi:MAG TPA: glutathione S-transferase family protein [Gammaproteobacteria bacterium]|nr:glutathione S-transferase family protein [Gammaproteobacteria bacterium]